MDRKLKIILFTLFLEMVSFGLIIPITPFIIQSYGVSEFFVGVSFSIYSIGTLLGGLYFGRLSDKLGRKKVLLWTILFHVIGYLLFSFAYNIILFLIARFIAGIGGSGISVAQAYISDISTPENRMKNMGMMGAVFGMGFLFGPVFGGILAGISENLNFIGGVSVILLLINLIIVKFFMEDSVIEKHPIAVDKKTLFEKLKSIDISVMAILGVSFITAFGFSGMQSTFALVMDHRFHLEAQHVGYLLGFIGVCSILYQAIGMNFIRKYLQEKNMMLFGLAALGISFFFFGVNQWMWAVFLIIPFFPIGYGSINPAIGSLLAKLHPKNIGAIMGYNTSSVSMGNIFGPFVAGSLYVYGDMFPYIFSGFLFFLAFFLAINYIKVGK